MTFTDFERLPDVPGKQELLDGELIVSPPPKDSHTQIAALVCENFRKYLDASRVRVERGFKIGEGWLQPDVSVSRGPENR